MNFKIFTQGQLATNCVLIEKDGCCVIVDIPYNSLDVIDYVKQNNLKVQGILLTHGHFDHCGGVAQFCQKCFCPNVDVYVHQKDKELCCTASLNVWGVRCQNCYPTKFVTEGVLVIGNFVFVVMETPGHTPGSVIYLIENVMISGDTLFRNSVGRTDLPGGNFEKLQQSLQKIKSLNNDYLIYSGHGPATFLKWELQDNPYLI